MAQEVMDLVDDALAAGDEAGSLEIGKARDALIAAAEALDSLPTTI